MFTFGIYLNMSCIFLICLITPHINAVGIMAYCYAFLHFFIILQLCKTKHLVYLFLDDLDKPTPLPRPTRNDYFDRK